MSKLRKIARDQECQMRSPYCNFMPETTVLAHLPSGGMATKSHDIHGAWLCSGCHDLADGRIKVPYSKDMIRLWFLEAVIRTQIVLLANGNVGVK